MGFPGLHRNKSSPQIECFWLCDVCAFSMTLILEPHAHEVVIVPLQNGEDRYSDLGIA